MDDYISRQAAISAICNACGKIDCDKMGKCEKLQLPPANCSEFPNNSDTISRQAAIDGKISIQRVNGVEIYTDEAVPVEHLKNVSAADVVPVVRCDDCVYYGSRRWCELHSSVFDDNAFCSYGERRNES